MAVTCACGSGKAVMPSTQRSPGMRGRCSTCHLARRDRYKATERGAAVHKATKARYRRGLRDRVQAAYGGKCACCGEGTPEFLTIDHVNNDGGGRKRTLAGQGFYLRLQRQGFPREGYQLLCWNCNVGKHLNGGVCPHVLARVSL